MARKSDLQYPAHFRFDDACSRASSRVTSSAELLEQCRCRDILANFGASYAMSLRLHQRCFKGEQLDKECVPSSADRGC